MFTLTIITSSVAVFSAGIAVLALCHARRSADAAERSVTEAKRSADAAERSAGAAAITAEADRAEDHRKRTPRLSVTVDQLAAHDGTEVIYRVTNDGPSDLESVVVHRPILGEVEGRIIHPVARTGQSYGDVAEIGPIAMGTYGRFTLRLGSIDKLPEFRVKVVSRSGPDEWSEIARLEGPLRAAPGRIRTARIS